MDFQSVVVRMLDIFFSSFLVGAGYALAAVLGFKVFERFSK